MSAFARRWVLRVLSKRTRSEVMVLVVLDGRGKDRGLYAIPAARGRAEEAVAKNKRGLLFLGALPFGAVRPVQICERILQDAGFPIRGLPDRWVVFDVRGP